MLRSLKRLFKRHPWRRPVVALYGQIVGQARLPVFYTRFGVPDTVDGRFELISLHTALVVRRLQDAGEDGPEIAQELFDLLFADMDRNLREMGVGDLSVGKHVRKMAEAYFGRSVAYDLALRPDADPTDLTEGLRRNLYRKTDDSVSESQVLAVAAYVRASHDHLATLSPAHIITGSGLFAAIPEEEG